MKQKNSFVFPMPWLDFVLRFPSWILMYVLISWQKAGNSRLSWVAMVLHYCVNIVILVKREIGPSYCKMIYVWLQHDA